MVASHLVTVKLEVRTDRKISPSGRRLELGVPWDSKSQVTLQTDFLGGFMVLHMLASHLDLWVRLV